MVRGVGGGEKDGGVGRGGWVSMVKFFNNMLFFFQNERKSDGF